MAIKLPVRNYLTFSELQSRWTCTENDLRHEIISRRLIPSFIWNDSVNVVTFFETADSAGPYWEPRQVANDREFDSEEDRAEFAYKSIDGEGFYYLMFPWQTGALNCNFLYLSKDRNITKQSGQPCLMIRPPKSLLTLDDVVKSGVVMMSEVLLFEGVPDAGTEKPLGLSERATLLKLVIGMAMKGYRYNPEALKSTATKEIADDLAALGMTLTDDTVRKYLKQAVDNVLPGKPRQP